jgi:tetratricopeptide (TPR) repeat protein
VDAERWDRILAILGPALELDTTQAESRLRAACADDPELFDEMAALLRADRAADSFFALPYGNSESVPAAGSPAPSPESWIGRRLGDYRLLEEIGRGGMGTVYLAERADREYESRVAIKMIQPGWASPELCERFRQERQILARLEHPGIARLLDGGTTDEGIPYLVLERVAGLPIDEHCESRGLGLAARLDLFCQVCAAVHAAHQNLVVHGDLKPGNVLVAADGTPKLLDFGIARVLAQESGSAAAPAVAWTPGFASPEQRRGEAVTTATDIYSLGVVLGGLLAGAAQPTGRPLPRDLQAIVEKAVRPVPTERYGSVEQLAGDVRRFLEHRPIAARPATRRYRLGRFLRRNRLAAALTAALLAVATGAAVSAGLQARRLAIERDHAERAFGLLAEAFRAADPESSGGRTAGATAPTVPELLAQVAPRLARELGDSPGPPGPQARLAATLGETYYSLGLYSQAETFLARALALRRRELGPEHPLVAERLSQLAEARLELGDHQGSRELLRQSLALYRRLGQGDSPGAAATIDGLGRTLARRGELARAEPLLRQALLLRERTPGGDPILLADTLGNLANVLRRRGEPDEARRLLERVVAIERRLLPPDHPRRLVTQQILALLLHDTFRFAEAERLAREILARQRARLGETHPAIAGGNDFLATIATSSGRWAEAEPLYLKALALRRRALGRSHPQVALTLSNLGEVRRRLGKLGPAEGGRGLVAAQTYLSLGKIERERGRLADAERSFRQAVALRGREIRPGDWRIADAQAELGACLAARGRHREAEPVLRESLAVLAAHFPADNPKVRRARRWLAEVERAAGPAGVTTTAGT